MKQEQLTIIRSTVITPIKDTYETDQAFNSSVCKMAVATFQNP